MGECGACWGSVVGRGAGVLFLPFCMRMPLMKLARAPGVGSVSSAVVRRKVRQRDWDCTVD